MEKMKKTNIKIIQYKWAGKWGPFKIKIDCGECGITESIIEHVISKKFEEYEIDFEVLPWLDNWYNVIFKGGFHAPIVLVNGKIISQGKLLDSSILEAEIRKNITQDYSFENKEGLNIVFSKKGCPYCDDAKDILKRNNIDFENRDIIESPDFGAQMFSLVKKIYPKDKPITVPQIFLNGEYFGTAQDLVLAEKEGLLTKNKNKKDV